MIHYQLRCSQDHSFDGWFKDSATFEKQAQLGLIDCPECGSTEVERALMAPALARREARREAVPAPVEAPQPPTPAAEPAVQPAKVAGGRIPAQMVALLQRMRAEVERTCDYVGNDFAEEARKMHRGEVEHRGIYGETSEEQAESLAEEGINVARIPWVPRADG
ncbi:DUF1178 family protein [Rhodopila globiformis]|uniref:Uncharacterized protein n=1 Tax=Rhodopila globiformis TaxID=1071 RepID=A0A2S6NIC8_RHOGL|nr:DUF1178 family protein [Rhodopila globiformis]PPQ34401.1 hypothetical protein CCS01_11050 [Rhodopila globiformis]